MSVLEMLKKAIQDAGVKEVARRSGLSASTISRINSGAMQPGLSVAEKISSALGYTLELKDGPTIASAPRLEFAKNVLRNLRRELEEFGVEHAVIFGSVARKEDGATSDIDIYLNFGDQKPKIENLLFAEGKILQAFGENRVDVISNRRNSIRPSLKGRIEKDGVNVF
jgi:predicted nucleotidyltransferase